MIRPLPLRCLALVTTSWIAACSAPTATGPAEGSALPPGSAAPASAATASAAPASATPESSPRAAAPALAASAPASASAAAPLKEPAAEASAAPTAAASASPSPSAAPEGPLPRVKVSNIGMHIGGGPNDNVTKEPIRRSVEPHFDAFRRCFARVEEPKKGDFGIDLRIDKAGGRAKVSHPRTALKGKDFEACVVRVFEEIDFLKPRGGTTVVSYSLRFNP